MKLFDKLNKEQVVDLHHKTKGTELIEVKFEFAPNDIVVIRPGDDRFDRTPTTFRVLARVAEDFGTGFTVHYQLRATDGNDYETRTFREEELILKGTYDAARKMLERPEVELKNVAMAGQAAPSHGKRW